MLNRLRKVLQSDMTALTWTLGWIGIILAFGFFVSGTDNNNYKLLNTTLPKSVWGGFYLLYGLSLLGVCLYKVRKMFIAFVSLVGVWLWSYLFFSFAIFDKTPIASTEWMLLLPIMVQLWVFFNLLSNETEIKKAEVQSQSDFLQMIVKIKQEVQLLNTELISLNKENRNLKLEVSALNDEVNRIRSVMSNKQD